MQVEHLWATGKERKMFQTNKQIKNRREIKRERKPWICLICIQIMIWKTYFSQKQLLYNSHLILAIYGHGHIYFLMHKYFLRPWRFKKKSMWWTSNICIYIARALWIAHFLYSPFQQQQYWPDYSEVKDTEFLMGKMLVSLTMLRKNINIITIQRCT